MSGITSVLLAILLLGILIAVHEAGHFGAARLTGIAVREFAIGFGPKLFGWTSKKTGTKFSLRLIPLGGFCSFYGEDDVNGEEQKDPRAFPKQKVWKRMLTVLMGPGMNFVLAFVVMCGFYMATGVGVYDPYIASIDENGPVSATQIQTGDIVISANGIDVRDGTATTLSNNLRSWQPGDEAIHLVLERRTDAGVEQIEEDVVPAWDEEYGRYRIGIVIGLCLRMYYTDSGWEADTRSCTIGESIQDSWAICKYAGGVILNGLKKLVTTGEGLQDTSGPVGVISMVSSEVQSGGMESFFWLLCMISINLGIMNLLPIPGLDGSRFLFMLFEVVRGKPIAQQKEAVVHLVGMLFLFAAMIFFTFRDVMNLFH